MKYLQTFLVLCILVFLGLSYYKSPPLGSVSVSNEYNSTTTNALSAPLALLKTGQGSLGSVVVTGAGTTGRMDFYNATTSNVNLRTGKVATSSIWLASFGATEAAGTYVFDVFFTKGLLVDITSNSSSTITFR